MTFLGNVNLQPISDMQLGGAVFYGLLFETWEKWVDVTTCYCFKLKSKA
jgi:hypothetical protein